MAGLAAGMLPAAATASGVERLVRFRRAARNSFGLLEGDTIQPLQGTLFDHKASGAKVRLADVQLLCPCEPSKILAVGLNYKSHVGTRTPPRSPEIFYKPITCALHPEREIVIPSDSRTPITRGNS